MMAATPITGPQAGVGKADMMIVEVAVGIAVGMIMMVEVVTGTTEARRKGVATTMTVGAAITEAIVGMAVIAMTVEIVRVIEILRIIGIIRVIGMVIAGIVRGTEMAIVGIVRVTGTAIVGIVRVTGTATVGTVRVAEMDIAGIETTEVIIVVRTAGAEASHTVAKDLMVLAGTSRDDVTILDVVMLVGVGAVAMGPSRKDRETVEMGDVQTAGMIGIIVVMIVGTAVVRIEAIAGTLAGKAIEVLGTSRSISWQTLIWASSVISWVSCVEPWASMRNLQGSRKTSSRRG